MDIRIDYLTYTEQVNISNDSTDKAAWKWLCSEFSVNARFHDKTVHILRSSEPEAEAEPPPMAARSVLDRLA